jgi:hypothetical protein
MKNILEKYKNENQNLTIILGSGFHSQGLGNSSILSNWSILLSKLAHANSLSGKYTLDFEKIIVNQTKNQNSPNSKKAYEIEKEELKRTTLFLKKEQEWVLSQSNRFKYPHIFNPKYVSDVISLNFDHVAEELCNLNYGNGEEVKSINESSFNEKYPKNSRSSIYQRTSHRKITDKQGNEIRFWYPHGSIQNHESITLGINRYARLVSDITRIRNYYKKQEKERANEEMVDLTWYSQILKNPVLILGASLSDAEWGLWSALVYKKRNYAKDTIGSYENDIYKMVDEKAQDKNLGYWYEPLFKDMNFNEQWKMIEESLSE